MESVLLAEFASLSGVFLLLTAFLAALLSTSVGAGGGLLILGMATVLPAPVVIPAHASVMMFGSFSGWLLLRNYPDYALLSIFIFGAVVGLIFAIPLIGWLNEAVMQFVLGSFLLATTWYRIPASLAGSKHYPWQCGLVSSFLSVMVGATRPMLLTLFGKRIDDHKVVVATTNACAALQHVGKLILFASFSAAFLQYWAIIGVLIVVTLLGAWCGRFVLISVGQRQLKLALKVLITGLALNLLVTALGLVP